MVFNSYDFLFLFLPAMLAVYFRTPARHRNLILTLGSWFFYGYWDYRFLSLVLLSTFWDFAIGRQLARTADAGRRKVLLVLSMVLNLGLLGVFKYAGFFLDSARALFPDAALPHLEIVLPIGISFYTFQSMSYTIDIYRGTARPVERFIDFACYIAMFPQLIAGPIVRYNTIETQLHTREFSVDNVAAGLRRFLQGLAKKILLADSMALIADPLFAEANPSFTMAWLGAVAYTLQIYLDFSGYSDMAIGLGRLFGFTLPENFNHPYRATSLSEFWRRWHISLSRWFRDYLYIPLGGSRRGPSRVAFNLLFTMLVCGLWHGAAWHFVVWGGYHGLILVLERPARDLLDRRLPRAVAVGWTYLLVVIGWVLFRTETLGDAIRWLGAMAGLADATASTSPVAPELLLALGLLQLACWLRPVPAWQYERASGARDLVHGCLFVVCVIFIIGGWESPYLYFQF